MQQSDPKGFYDAISGKATGAEDQSLGAEGQDHRCPGKPVLRQKKLLPQNTDEPASDPAALNKKPSRQKPSSERLWRKQSKPQNRPM
ncbi:MAG: hypothetical protein NTY67_02240 [Cyanobacteria bacterium]|nr:hypothetical protein [Cyanobacteriota bacterium]